MDRIIKITLGLFLVILAGTIGYAIYSGFVTESYQSTLTSSYSYSMSITTDHPLTNVTLFVPVPTDRDGNSPVVSTFSAQAMPGVPNSWQTLLFDTGKATLLKIRIPALIPPAGTTAEKPYTLTFSVDLPSEKVIDTADPFTNDAVFRPVQNFQRVACTGTSAGSGGSPECSLYTTSLYAIYAADPATKVTITSSISGRNRWSVFGPVSNEYISIVSLQMQGEKHGWATMQGTMTDRAGSYDYPFHLP